MIMIAAAWSLLAGCDKQAPSPASLPSTAPATQSSTSPAAEASSQPAGPALDLGNNVAMKLVLIPSGTFMMGSPEDEQDRQDDEGPRHQVTITKPFYIGMYAVTQEQYELIMRDNPSRFRGPQNPVETTSWDEATAFCSKLSQKTGKKIHLPTEAQWEYACRAGTTARFSFGDDEAALKDSDAAINGYAWCGCNSDSKTHPIGQKKPNPWGLYDMHGNVWQWCSDWYADSYINAKSEDPKGPDSGRGRVLRGGSWCLKRQICRSAFRAVADPGGRVNGFAGFRVVVDVDDDSTPEAIAPAAASR
jgi:formylglycine-generating enzyme required for sulfatase activity